MLRLSLSFLPSRIILPTLVAPLLVIGVSACGTRARSPRLMTSHTASDQQLNSRTATNQQQPPKININNASASELESLPGIGKALAARIVEHREKYGPFRRVEHLIIVRGISDNRFRALRELITVE